MMHEEISRYSAQLSQDPLLVQGAGGNISWKDKENNTLWIKASGCWLSEAVLKDIFVPVDLENLNQAISSKNYAAKPQVLGAHPLRPSIETIFHGLMPQKIVVHLHAVDILAHLVQKNCEETISNLIQIHGIAQFLPPGETEISRFCRRNFREGLLNNYAFVDYHKPGEELAEYMALALTQNPAANIIFLKNHGVVIAGETLEVVDDTLKNLLCALKLAPADLVKNARNNVKTPESYISFPDEEVHQLALNPSLFDKLKTHWALYPDHVVFLGAEPHCYESSENISADKELIFVKNKGVFMTPLFNRAKQQQLRCYYDVLSRLKEDNPGNSLQILTPQQINELLDWEAERYRINLNVKNSERS
jgi:rhamnose utilization protein RhaD (predicted bifunctional aldolase and dehydrogenase)